MNAPARISPACDDGERSWSRQELDDEVARLAAWLRDAGTRVLGTLLDNSPTWIAADLAAAQAGVVHVPFPLFFSREQIGHALAAAGVDTLIFEIGRPLLWPSQSRVEAMAVMSRQVGLTRLTAVQATMPAGTSKITFTSGTTGAPKGVCLGDDGLQRVVTGIRQVLAPRGIRRHLCALPLALLLENVAGVLAPLAQGATCIVVPLARLGLIGSSSFDAIRFDATVRALQAESLILLPEMLRAWVATLRQRGDRAPDSLKFVAVGGAAVGSRLLAEARARGIPAYEGYGLSEGGSVQTLNLPGSDRPGSVGRTLPHARIRIGTDGEVELAGTVFLGYLGGADAPSIWWPTGDLGSLDADGFLHIEGRKRNVLITSFGRNVSPEWIETELRADPGIAQVVVFGDDRPALSAVLWPVRAESTDVALQAAVDATNSRLPDYARIHHWVRGCGPFDVATGFATPTGRARRRPILDAHAEALGLALASHAH